MLIAEKDRTIRNSLPGKQEIYLLAKASIISLCCSESNNRIYDCGRINGCEAIDQGDNHSVLLAVIAANQNPETQINSEHSPSHPHMFCVRARV